MALGLSSEVETDEEVVEVLGFLPLRPLEEDEDETEEEEELVVSKSERVTVIVGAEVMVEVNTSVMVIVVEVVSAPPWSSMPNVEVLLGLLLSSDVVFGLSSIEVVGDAIPEVDDSLLEDELSSSFPPFPLPLSGCAARFVMIASVGDTTSSVEVEGTLSSVEVAEALSSVLVAEGLSSVLVTEALVAVLVRVTPVTKPVPVGTTPVA